MDKIQGITHIICPHCLSNISRIDLTFRFPYSYLNSFETECIECGKTIKGQFEGLESIEVINK